MKISPPSRPKTSKHLQHNPQNVPIDKDTLKLKLDNITNEISTLSTKLKNAREEEESRQQALETFRKRKADQQIKIELESARKDQKAQQTEFDNFHNRMYPFSSACDRLLAITPLYKRDVLFSCALARNHSLNLDHVLVNTNQSALIETVDHISHCANTFARKLFQICDSNRTSISAYSDDYATLAKTALRLNHLLNNASLTENAQRLVNTLVLYLGTLSKRRPLGRSTPGAILMRFTVRYLARGLVGYLSYWSWKELFSEEEQDNRIDQHVLDTLVDLYVTFAMLEERIEGRLPVCEGILMVKERLEENQEKSVSRDF